MSLLWGQPGWHWAETGYGFWALFLPSRGSAVSRRAAQPVLGPLSLTWAGRGHLQEGNSGPAFCIVG